MTATAFWQTNTLRKESIETAQINLGNRCNQACSHCHMGASPAGRDNMDAATAGRVLDKLLAWDVRNVEFTGGTPEMNPNLPLFIRKLAAAGKSLTVRTSLTVLDLPEYDHVPALYRDHNVRIVASLPGLFEDEIDRQRGAGVHAASMKVLAKLNDLGYGTDGRVLDLAYNAVDDRLPPDQTALEGAFRQALRERHGIVFNRLAVIVNTPINRFRQYLLREGRLDRYVHELKERFNPATLDRIMCRKLVSVNFEGKVFDCDFNLALGVPVRGYENERFWVIDFGSFAPEISCSEHCWACTANLGSSCGGALLDSAGPETVRDSVRLYYSETVKKTSDLKTTACCTPGSLPGHVRDALACVADEIKERYYGCGSPIPLATSGLAVLDLGCGTGRDSYIMAKLVGEKGFVTGIDMTREQIDVARKYLAVQTRRFGYAKANCEFILDEIENAGDHIAPGTLDLVISNCVVNLVEDKERVLRQVHRMLKQGGEFYFSDIYADRRVPGDLAKDPVLYGECLGGALYLKDFERIARRAGFSDPRLLSVRPVEITNPEIRDRVGAIRFLSATYRLWKIDGLEDACEDYGHVALYRGGIDGATFAYRLDHGHRFEKDRPERVCGNTALMLSRTRLGRFFEVTGSFGAHFGAFPNCRTTAAAEDGPSVDGGSCC